ncbi:bile acid:sodium symporter family protein [Skeletonema marinoi]|uniref:Bile acid:sodium symporter family protein n=1 Tax=Skeletonema marinoi TaxID=267567 RepID=A0AAD8XZ62_9STRA|nr:bile acid:sodium symporter family protein [Skeletonema marinoi]
MSLRNMMDTMDAEIDQMVADNSSELSDLLISNSNSNDIILAGIDEITTERQMNSIIESEWFDILSQTISSALLFLLIFGMSATVEVKHLREQPGGSYSNWWCSMFNADLALSVTMTAISTMVSSIMLPANLLLYVNAAFGASSGSDEISSHRFNRFANRMGSMSGILLVIFSGVLSSLSGDKQAQIWGQPERPCLVGLFIATCAGVCARLKRPEVVSVGVECCYQNVGIATSAAVAMFDNPSERGQALLVPLFYGLMEAVVLGLYCLVAWKLGWTKAPRDESFCTMFVTTYEVDDDDESIQSPTPDESMDEIDVEIPGTRSPEVERSDSVDTWSSRAPVEYDTSWSRWPWKMFIRKEKRRKRKDSEDSPPDINPTTMPSTSVKSVKRRSILSPISEDAFGTPSSLVSFEDTDKGSYSRCRLGSEEATVASSILSESPNSSPSRSLFPDDHKA